MSRHCRGIASPVARQFATKAPLRAPSAHEGRTIPIKHPQPITMHYDHDLAFISLLVKKKKKTKENNAKSQVSKDVHPFRTQKNSEKQLRMIRNTQEMPWLEEKTKEMWNTKEWGRARGETFPEKKFSDRSDEHVSLTGWQPLWSGPLKEQSKQIAQLVQCILG